MTYQIHHTRTLCNLVSGSLLNKKRNKTKQKHNTNFTFIFHKINISNSMYEFDFTYLKLWSIRQLKKSIKQMTIRMHSFCWDYSIITNETKQNKSRSQMLLYFALSQSHPQTVKLRVKHMQICIEIDCTTISTLHKLIDKWLTRSVQNICNSEQSF